MSGECPVKPHECVGGEKIGAVPDYIERLLKERYQRGGKYFYGHLIQ